MKRAITLAILLIAGSPALAQDRPNPADVRLAFFDAAVAALTAKNECQGMEINVLKLGEISSLAGVTDAVLAAHEDELSAVIASIRDAVEKAGRADWCSNVWRMMGPEGILLPNLLERVAALPSKYKADVRGVMARASGIAAE